MVTTPTASGRFEAIQTVTLVGQVLGQIRQAILGGAVRPGEPLHDSTLATEMGVSRAPVREALRMLQNAGLVTKLPNQPYVVTAFDDADLEDLAYMRVGLETLAVKVVVGRRPDPAPVSAALPGLSHAVASGEESAIIRADREFHESLVRLAGSKRLSHAYAELRDQMELAMMSTDAIGRGVDGIVERHVRLVEELGKAIETGDATQLVGALERHITDGLNVTNIF